MEIFKNVLSKQGEDPAMTVMSGVAETEVGPPAVYGGNEQALHPEEMFVASINSCIMLVFYHFVNKFKVNIASYSSEANGIVEKTKNGLRFTNVKVEAKVVVGDDTTAEKIQEMAELAERFCLVSGSVACPVEYEVTYLTE